MKKNSIASLQGVAKGNTKGKVRQIHGMAAKQRMTVGLDLGDRFSRYCILDEAGEKAIEDKLPTSKAGLTAVFGKMARCRIALEVGTHSPWVSRQLAEMGHEVIVANPHRVKLITQSLKKSDRMDAEQLARLARVDAKLLAPIRHRGPEAQADLAVIRARAALLDARTQLINSARGLAKPMGERLKKCDADYVKEGLAEGMGEAVQAVIRPMLKSVEAISKEIGEYDRKIEGIAQRYPEMKLLTQVHGVGTLIALSYILTIEDAQRFEHSRDVGPYLGLTRKRHDSGESEPELGITKAGDQLVRKLLVQGAHCIVRQGAPDSDLKAWAMARLQAGGQEGGTAGCEPKGGRGKKGKKQKVSKKAKKKTIVAVARKLAVLLHHLWVTGEVYEPRYNRKTAEAAKGKVA